MKTIKNILLVCITSILFSSCIGKSKGDTKNKETQQNSIGKIVSKLAPNTHLMYQDKKHNYWFVNDSKVYKYDGKILLQFTQKDGLISNRIIGIQEDKLGNIYFDTPEGVSKFDGQRFETLKIIKDDSLRPIWKADPDDLWFRIGWDKKGPYKFDGKKLYHLEFPKSEIEGELYAKYPNISYNPYSIYSIYKDSKGNIWFGTADLGIYRFDGNQVQWMYEEHLGTTPEGAAFGIRSIMEDEQGYFWISNNSYKYQVLLNDTTKSYPLQTLNYTRKKGLRHQNEEVLYFMSMLPDDKGVLWMVNGDGMWRNDGTKLTPFFIQDGNHKISPSSIYQDHQGNLWLGTQKNGIYTYNRKVFKKILF